MTRFVLRTVFTMLLTFIVLSQYAIAQRSVTSAWKPEEMTRSGTKDLKSLYKNKKVEVKALHVWLNNLKRHLEENNLKEEPPTNCSDQCFDLYYFTGNNFNLNSSRRNILYIAGGPGQIVKSPRPLSDLSGASGANFSTKRCVHRKKLSIVAFAAVRAKWQRNLMSPMVLWLTSTASPAN